MKKASIIMAVLACAIIAAAYTNSVPISANTRAATEKWTAIRFEPALPPTPENAASKFLNGNREWQTVASAQPQSVVSVNGQTGAVSITAASLGAITAELDPVANAKLTVHTNRADNPHSVTAVQIGALTAEADPVAGPRLDRIEPETNKWNAAYGWGDHAAVGYLLPAALTPYATTASLTVHTNRIDNPHKVTAVQIGALTAELDPVANAKLVIHTNRADNPHSVTAVQIGAITAELDPVANAKLAVHTNRIDNPHSVTAAQVGAITAELDPVANAALTVHKNRADNPHSVTAAQIGAITNEQDLAALRAYHYGSPDIVESPAGWFVFDVAGTITGFNWAEGRTNVVIPWAIGGVPVTAIGWNAFESSGIVSLIAPKTVASIEVYAFDGCHSLASISLPQVQTVGNNAFASCSSLASISLPQVQTVGENAFASCSSLASVSLPHAQTVGASAFVNCTSLASVYFDNDAPAIGAMIFAGITPNQVTNYVTNPQATGWETTLGGMPVVRPPLYADAIYQAGELVATTGQVAQAVAPLGPRLDRIEAGTNAWHTAYAWGNHALAGYLLPAALAPYATTGHVAQAIAAIPEPDLSDRPTFAQIAASNALPYTDWTGTVTPQNGTATVAYAHGNMPVLVVPNGGGKTHVTVATGTYAATSGVSRVSLSIWAGTNTIELVTNEVDYATAPDIPTNGWGTILFRRVSNGKWKGVGL